MSGTVDARGKTPGDLPHYRLLTGADDRAFCERVSEALGLGWQLYGHPAISVHGSGQARVAQAVLWPDA